MEGLYLRFEDIPKGSYRLDEEIRNGVDDVQPPTEDLTFLGRMESRGMGPCHETDGRVREPFASQVRSRTCQRIGMVKAALKIRVRS